jgi:hypothetical protein
MVANSLPLCHLQGDDCLDALTSARYHHSEHVDYEATPSLTDNTTVASVLHPGVTALPIGPLFGGDPTSLSNSMSGDNMPYNHGPAPTDGETVWFCSECGDGPIGSWQASCPSCYHTICGSCRHEKV